MFRNVRDEISYEKYGSIVQGSNNYRTVALGMSHIAVALLFIRDRLLDTEGALIINNYAELR